MTSFSSLLSSLGGPAQAPQQSSTTQQKASQPNNDIRKLTNATNGVRLAPDNAVAGVKRKSEEPEAGPRPKTARSEQDRAAIKPSGSASRFQLSGKGASTSRPVGGQQSSTPRPSTSSGPQKPTQHPTSRPPSKPGITSSPTPPSTANGPAPPKRGFASIMERAKAAQEDAKAKASAGIKHKPMEKMSRKERLRMMEEAKAQHKSVKRRKQNYSDRSRSGTPATNTAKAGPTETSFKGTMKKKAEPLAYKGTMRAVGPGEAKENPKTKGQTQDKYGGYARWSDLDDEEDEEEGYGSDGSSDMDAGWDDVEEEESRALRVARKEDQEALEEEERLRRDKLERKKRLEELSRSAAGKKRF